MDDLARTFLSASTALSAETVIDGGVKIGDLDRTCGAGTLAELTADTSHLAVGACDRALFRGYAAHPKLCAKRDQADDVLRTSGDAHTARATLFIVYLCNAVFDMDGVKFAGGNTGAKPDTAVGTALVSTAQLSGSIAVMDTVVDILGLGSSGSAATHDLCAHTHDLALRCNAHQLIEGGSVFLFVGTTRSRGELSLDHCLRKGGTACLATATAICAWEQLHDLWDALVYLDLKELPCDRKQDAEHTAQHRKPKQCP